MERSSNKVEDVCNDWAGGQGSDEEEKRSTQKIHAIFM